MMGRLGKRVRIVKAAPQQELKMRLTFEDGVSKVVDLEPMMQGPIFESLRENPALFRDVKIEGGTIAWANGADIDPDVLYYDLKPAWMEVPESA
jgi:hypothetical protein